MQISKPTQALITLALVAAMAISLGFWLFEKAELATVQSGVVLQRPMALKSFTLTATNGEHFTNAALKNHWSLLFFGFSRCPMLCPTTLAKLNGAYEWLKSRSPEEAPQIIFISVDPKRDTPAELRRYLNQFNNAFVGAVGNHEELKKLTQPMGIAYMRAQKSGENEYDIQHSGAIMVINPNGRLVAILSRPDDATTIAQDFLRIQKSWR